MLRASLSETIDVDLDGAKHLFKKALISRTPAIKGL